MKIKEHQITVLSVHQEADVQVKRYKICDLATMYGVSKPTFRKWLQPYKQVIGRRIGNFYTSRQVNIIFEILGLPDQNQAA